MTPEDTSKWTQDQKLASLHPDFRPRVEAVIAALKEQGYQPHIVYGWRSVTVQAQLVAEGKSKVQFSFHNAQKPDGTPAAWAADLIDRRWGWRPEAKPFWDALGTAAHAQGLVWGGDWKTFKDWAHIQGRQNAELAAVRRESGLA